MAQEEVIKENFLEYFELAEYAFEKKKFNGAVTLYYKALVELCDIALLRKTGSIGSNHNIRFKLLETHESSLYQIASTLFDFYRDSYSQSISETVAKTVREKVNNARAIVLKEED